MPKRVNISLLSKINPDFLSFEGIDGSIDLLTALLNREQERVITDGPGAAVFCLRLIQETLDLGGRVAIILDEATQAEWKSKLASLAPLDKTPPSADLLQRITRFNRFTDWAHRSLFDQHPLADLVGLSLAYRDYKGRNLLSKQISFSDFEFSSAEYLELKDKVVITQRLFQKIERITPDFQALNAGIFRHQTQEDSHEFIGRLLGKFISEAEKLHRSFLAETNRFYEGRRNEYQGIFHTLSIAIQRVADARELLIAEIGESAVASIPNRLVASLNKRQKQHRESIIQLQAFLQALMDAHLTTAPFPFTWPEQASELPQSEWPGLIARYNRALEAWFDDHRKLIREECLGLSPSTHAVDPVVTERLLTLETEFTTLLEQINDSGIFQRPFTVQAGTTARQQKLVEQLLEQFLELRRLLPTYPAFYRWQYNWFSLPARLRRVITPMLLLPEENWETLFSSWYFDQGIHQQPKAAVATMSPREVTELAGAVIVARALKTTRIKKAPSKNKPVFYQEVKEDQVGEYDLIIDAGKLVRSDQLSGPRLRFAPFTKAAEGVHYLSSYGEINPVLAFFQDWRGTSLPDWQAADHTSSWQDVKRTLEQLAENRGISLAAEWPRLEIAYRERGRNGLFIGVTKGGKLQVMELSELGQSSFDTALIIFTSDQLVADQLPTATHWWSLLLNTPHITILHRLTANEITQALLTDGADAAYGFAAFLRAAEAIEDQDSHSFRAIAKESRSRLGWKSPPVSPLLKELEPELKKRFPTFDLKINHPWRTVYLPILLTSPTGKRHLILPDGVLSGKRDALIELQLQREIAAAGFEIHYLFSMDLAADMEGALDSYKFGESFE